MLDAGRLRKLVALLQARAQPPFPCGLTPVRVGDVHVGDSQPAIAAFVAANVKEFFLTEGALVMADQMRDIKARSAVFAEAAIRLRDAGLVSGWRDELLAIGRPPIAVIERAACRALGITTEAVHLNAYVDTSALIVARRAAHKQFDPGKWDNLVGGMVAAEESCETALAREAWEEAGVRLDSIELRRGRCFQTCRPVPEGLQSEIIHVFDALLPSNLQPQNQDGEVAAIERRTIAAVVDAIESDEFTLEAALVTLESLTRRNGIESPAGLFVDHDASSIHAI